MNVHTFQDAVKSKRSSLANDLENDLEDEEIVKAHHKEVEGEEEEGTEKFNENGDVIEPFNLRNEREEGLDESAEEALIGEAALAEKRRLARQVEKEAVEQQQMKKTPKQLLEELLTFILPGEKITTALRRLSGKTDGADKGIKRRRANSLTNEDKPQKKSAKELREESRKNRAVIEQITELADLLIANGVTGIYEMTYEAIRTSCSLWEYRGADGQIYGPFTSQQIAGWKAQGFLTGNTAVAMRRVGSGRSTQSKPSMSMYDDETEDSGSKEQFDEAKKEADEWVSSDSIDFGVVINLDQEASRTASASSSVNTPKSRANQSSNMVDENDRMRRVNDDDEEENDLEEERSRRRKRGLRDENQDSDEEDDD
eukprot:scaffold691_cov181-Ochromonas_danica.AAC.5